MVNFPIAMLVYQRGNPNYIPFISSSQSTDPNLDVLLEVDGSKVIGSVGYLTQIHPIHKHIGIGY